MSNMELDESFGEIDNDDLEDMFDYTNDKKKPASNQASNLNPKKSQELPSLQEKRKTGSR